MIYIKRPFHYTGILMEKKTAIIAVAIVAIIVFASVAIALVYTPPSQEDKVIYWTPIAPVQQKAALQAGTIDGAVSWEPYVSDSLSDGTANAVVWSNDVWSHHPCCVIAVKQSYLATTENQDLIARLVRANMDATVWVVETVQQGSGTNYTTMLDMGAQFSARTPAVVQNAVQNIGFENEITPSVKQWFANFTSMFADLGQIQGLAGYANVTAFVNGITNTTFLEKALTVQPSATILNPDNPIRLGFLNGDLHQFARVVAMNTSLWGGQTLFEKYGIKVTSPAPYANGGYVMDAFAANIIDVGYLGCPPTILKRINSDIKVQIVSVVNTDGSAIIAKSGISNFDGLNKKIVATPGPASIQHLLLLWYCTEHGYKLKLTGT